jgi:TRAP transporter TAXI family solute receptor
MTRIRTLAFALATAGSLAATGVQAADVRTANMDKFLAMGSGAQAGVFYPVGQGVCDIINKDRLTHGLRCLNYETGGAVYNMQAVSFGTVQLGIARSDLSFQAYTGTGNFDDEPPIEDMRAVASLYSVPVAVIAKRSLGLTYVKDIKGKRFNIGNDGSGKRELSSFIMKLQGWTRADFAATTEYDTGPMVKAFCDGELDVILEGLGNPAKMYADVTEKCDGQFLPFSPETIDQLKADYPYYVDMAIPGGMYAGTPDNVASFGYRAILIASSKVHPDAIYQVVSSLVGNLKDLRAKHASLDILTPQAMANFGIYIPLHDGAARYYKEHNLLEAPAAPAK